LSVLHIGRLGLAKIGWSRGALGCTVLGLCYTWWARARARAGPGAGGGSSEAICLPPPARSSSRGGGVACLDAPRFGVGACGAWSVGGARAVCRRLPRPTPCLWGVGPSPRTRHVFPQRAPARWYSPAAGVARRGVVRVATLGSPRRNPLKRLGGSTVENLKMTW